MLQPKASVSYASQEAARTEGRGFDKPFSAHLLKKRLRKNAWVRVSLLRLAFLQSFRCAREKQRNRTQTELLSRCDTLLVPSLLHKAVPAKNRPTLGRLEGHFALLSAVGAGRLVHLPRALVEIPARPAVEVAPVPASFIKCHLTPLIEPLRNQSNSLIPENQLYCMVI